MHAPVPEMSLSQLVASIKKMRLELPAESVVKNLEDISQEKVKSEAMLKADLSKTNALATASNNMTQQRNSQPFVSQEHIKTETRSAEREKESQSAPAPTLDIIERTRYGRDRAGIIFSNILSQCRQRMIPHDQIKCGVDFNGYSEYQNGQAQINDLNKRTFFKTATNEINYRHILGFDLKDGEDFEPFEV